MNILTNKVVQGELARIERLIGTDDGRNVEYDLAVLEGNLSLIQEWLNKGGDKNGVIIDSNMWDECHTSFNIILDSLDLKIDFDNSNEFDYELLIVKKEVTLDYFLRDKIYNDLVGLFTGYMIDADNKDDELHWISKTLRLADMSIEQLIKENLEYVTNDEMLGFLNDYITEYFKNVIIA